MLIYWNAVSFIADVLRHTEFFFLQKSQWDYENDFSLFVANLRQPFVLFSVIMRFQPFILRMHLVQFCFRCWIICSKASKACITSEMYSIVLWPPGWVINAFLDKFRSDLPWEDSPPILGFSIFGSFFFWANCILSYCQGGWTPVFFFFLPLNKWKPTVEKLLLKCAHYLLPFDNLKDSTEK